MWPFVKKEIIYVDKLQKYRTIERDGIHLLDEVNIVTTFEESRRRHPASWRYEREPYIETEDRTGIVIELNSRSWFYSKKNEIINFDGWEANILFWSEFIYEYKYHKWYWVLRPDGKIIYAHTVVKVKWEFSETFDYIQEAERQKKIVLEAQEKYEESLKDMGRLLQKWKEIQKNAFSNFNP